MAQGASPVPWWRRALRVGLLSFVLAVFVSYVSAVALGGLPAAVAFLVVLLLVATGVAFDILGTSVTSAEQSPLHAMAAKKVSGAKQALWLVRNAGTVSNFTNDVVGDVTGAVTGAAATTVALQISLAFQAGALSERLTELGMVGLVAGLTVGAKAAGKGYAIARATDVVFLAGRLLNAMERMTGRTFTGGRGQSSSRRRTT